MKHRKPQFFPSANVVTVFLIISAVLASCNKNSPTAPSSRTPPLGITATINGVTKHFTYKPYGYKRTFGGISSIEADASMDSSSVEEFFVIVGKDSSINPTLPIVPRTYTSDTTLLFDVQMAWVEPGGLGDYAGTIYDGWDSHTNQVLTNHLKITITSITATSFIGAFSGNLYLGGITTNPPIPVTNGTFNVRF